MISSANEVFMSCLKQVTEIIIEIIKDNRVTIALISLANNTKEKYMTKSKIHANPLFFYLQRHFKCRNLSIYSSPVIGTF